MISEEEQEIKEECIRKFEKKGERASEQDMRS